VPRATFVAIGAITLLYLALQMVTRGVLGPDLGSQRAPLAEAARGCSGTSAG